MNDPMCRSGYELSITRVFDAPRALVFAVCVQPDQDSALVGAAWLYHTLLLLDGPAHRRHLARGLASRDHTDAVYIMQGNVIANHAEALSAFDASRTVLRFHPAQIPTAMVVQLVRARAAELEEIGASA